MKQFIILLFGAAWFCTPAAAQAKEGDAQIQKAFTSIKNVDEQAFLQLFPDYVHMKAMFALLGQNIKDSQMRKDAEKEFAGFTEQRYNEEFVPELKKNFQRFVSGAREKGIDLSKLDFVSSVYEVKHQDEVGLKTLKGNMNVKDDRQEYEISFSDIIWSEADGKWFGINLEGIKKKGEEGENADINVVDSSLMVVEPPMQIDSVKTEPIKTIPAPPSKQKTKTVTKSSPARKTKTKS
jgi:hypothetical protein